LKIDEVTKEELNAWIAARAAEDDLCSGRIPGFSVELVSKTSTRSGWTLVGTAKLSDIIVPISTARMYATLDDYLASEGVEQALIKAIGELIIGDTKPTAVYASEFRSCYQALPAAAAVAIIPIRRPSLFRQDPFRSCQICFGLTP
jgi:hypothetical protein